MLIFHGILQSEPFFAKCILVKSIWHWYPVTCNFSLPIEIPALNGNIGWIWVLQELNIWFYLNCKCNRCFECVLDVFWAPFGSIFITIDLATDLAPMMATHLYISKYSVKRILLMSMRKMILYESHTLWLCYELHLVSVFISKFFCEFVKAWGNHSICIWWIAKIYDNWLALNEETCSFQAENDCRRYLYNIVKVFVNYGQN